MSNLLFDSARAELAKVKGMSAAAFNRAEQLTLARSVAVIIATRHGVVSIDDVMEKLSEHYGIDSIGNAAGSVFKKGFVFTGQWLKSARVSNHGRPVRVWRLKY